MSRAIMGSDLFEPVDAAEADGKKHEADNKQDQCEGHVQFSEMVGRSFS